MLLVPLNPGIFLQSVHVRARLQAFCLFGVCVYLSLLCVCVCESSLRGHIIAVFRLQEQMFGFVNTGAKVCSGSPGE